MAPLGNPPPSCNLSEIDRLQFAHSVFGHGGALILEVESCTVFSRVGDPDDTTELLFHVELILGLDEHLVVRDDDIDAIRVETCQGKVGRERRLRVLPRIRVLSAYPLAGYQGFKVASCKAPMRLSMRA
ncbi:hypothetical protein GUJ93_ZPchr0010g8218 [Zizania palustris]|uniref:Uncharacterized protein n=1 Tax=Zizania palustris TaxID=103762 RepID=A0A8J6BH38_ZIZPA|nr:hypothetical protein GUJ93_ZPchr0010g8218 [Zizania palustris]